MAQDRRRSTDATNATDAMDQAAGRAVAAVRIQRPVRIQRRRSAGWRMPPGAVYVGRPTRWGNPFVVGAEHPAAECVAAYRRWLAEPEQLPLRTAARRELAGHDLACWCPPGQPCHADVLLELVSGRAGGRPGRPCGRSSP
jgi:hypothetical protein